MELKREMHLEVKDQIGIITLDNHQGNSLNKPYFIEQADLAAWLNQNSIKGVIIQGAGRHFSSGANLENLFELAHKPGELESEIAKGKLLLKYIENLSIPVIAAINGVCFGGGLEIAMACHIRVSSENALFAFPEINHGLFPGLGGIEMMNSMSSKSDTIEFVLKGDMLNAEEALRLKIIDRIVSGGDVFDYSYDLLKKMTEGRSQKLIKYVMQSIHNSKNLSIEEAMIEETKYFCELAVDELLRREKEASGQ